MPDMIRFRTAMRTGSCRTATSTSRGPPGATIQGTLIVQIPDVFFYLADFSKYTLNGTTVKFDKLAKILRMVGIDLIHNRFLILQVRP